MYLALIVECADNAALEDRPETFNRVRVERADYVLLAMVIDRLTIVFGLQKPAHSRPKSPFPIHTEGSTEVLLRTVRVKP